MISSPIPLGYDETILPIIWGPDLAKDFWTNYKAIDAQKILIVDKNLSIKETRHSSSLKDMHINSKLKIATSLLIVKDHKDL